MTTEVRSKRENNFIRVKLGDKESFRKQEDVQSINLLMHKKQKHIILLKEKTPQKF